MAQSLVLNQNYEAITLISAQKAFLLVFLDKAEAVDYFPDRFFNTIHQSFPIPCTVRLKVYVNLPYKNVLLAKRNVMKRDNYRCQYCGKSGGTEMTVDHVIPKSLGGKDIWENLVAACKKCNNRKSNRTPDQAGMKLLSTPFKPSYVLFLRQNATHVEEKWKPYLFMT